MPQPEKRTLFGRLLARFRRKPEPAAKASPARALPRVLREPPPAPPATVTTRSLPHGLLAMSVPDGMAIDGDGRIVRGKQQA